MAESEIPADIRATAQAAWEQARLMSFHAHQIDIIAEAIMAERQRCASIEPESDVDVVTTSYEDGYFEGFRDCEARYRSAILSPEPAIRQDNPNET